MSDSPTRTIKEFDPEEQPREKAARFGIASLTLPELLALILRTGVHGVNILDMARNLIRDNGGSLHSLARRTPKEMMATFGMGPTKALQVAAIMELAKRYFQEESRFRPEVIRSSEDIYNIMRFDIANASQEQIWILTLNRRNAVIERHHLTTGSAIASIFDLKLALKLAILDEACGVVLCHNHPSGNLRPSTQDDSITRALKEGAARLDMRMIDHLIISAEGFYSYSDEGRL